MSTMKREQAEAVALRALAHIAGDERALQGLLAQTGLDGKDLAQAPGDPVMLAGILDFLLADEMLAVDFCQAQSLDPTLLGRARRALPGGEIYEY